MERCFSQKIYYDRTFDTMAVKLLPGEYHVTDRDMMIVTVLGSCVSVCIRDRERGIGGMNHFMLPGDSAESLQGAASARYGLHAMDWLLQRLLQLGGKRAELEAKVFGAGKVMNSMADVGRKNADFALQYLRARGIPVSAVDMGDIYPRKVYFSPVTGKVFVKQLKGRDANAA